MDTFYNYFTLPEKEYNFFRDFVQIYQKDIICGADKTNCMFPGACKARYSKLPDMTVQFGDNHTFSLSPQLYLKDISIADKPYCDI